MKKSVLTALAALLALAVFTTSSAMAQTRVKIIKGQDRVMFKKNTKIDFDGSAVEGELVKPEGSYMVQRSRVKFDSLIEPRKHFNREMFQNARKL
ncbi:MAG: hypothetical protein H6727_05315 [Myxococcales bacterium]|nr:hypothetical protein [Myxococcales bacterium]